MYIAVCRFCVACCFIVICFSCYFIITLLTSINILFTFHFLFFTFVFYFMNSGFFVLFCILFLRLCCLFPIFVQVYLPLSLAGNPNAVNNTSCH